jgi:hypothetical protein
VRGIGHICAGTAQAAQLTKLTLSIEAIPMEKRSKHAALVSKQRAEIEAATAAQLARFDAQRTVLEELQRKLRLCRLGGAPAHTTPPGVRSASRVDRVRIALKKVPSTGASRRRRSRGHRCTSISRPMSSV